MSEPSRSHRDRTVLLSTHIVEDIAQTCRELTVVTKGRLVFRGTVAGLTATAEGRVWSVVTPGPPPEAGTVVSILDHTDGMEYRVVAPQPPVPHAVAVKPTLEEGYVALTSLRATTVVN